ncbi:putative TIR domain, P-loop containing nucleoside triphosphate hydrolase [Medicago truncatula]|uniref:Putative TIR domain, P-loop containing nucleoside triphosphate hydrolase n=1 Tax=Medicago truncatula TaxID=3880 RepID=A0A396HK88_MEDTR|nr:disease resistance protein RPV1 [Medicago truncatula]RHN52284.1 putative TIR domain, P-loop containing nucleoside triphosphate hydrolase [Medicago truncatula]
MAMQSPSRVFLSFRGSDTRNTFTGNLYKALVDKGIRTFFDDNDLQRGDEITPSLVKAIEESRIFIPIFSANYASSSFCLDELVHIIHCYKTKSCLVLPVFYDVEPTHIRHQSGSYGEYLTKHEERFQNNEKNMERLRQWKIALTQAANLSGYHYSPHGYEYKFIEKIVEDISNNINHVFLNVAKYPVGLQSRIEQVKLLLDMGSEDVVHMVGLYGTGGMGKSTLAKAVYNFVADQFEGVCFLHNVRESSTLKNLKHLQKKLLSKIVKFDGKLEDVSEGIPIIKERLSRKKILLILDDVDKLEQLEALAGGLDWFGHGSRVIITTRDKHLLACHGITSTHAVEELNETEALELLRRMAFKNDKVPSTYEEILNRVVTYASGLPLAIVTIGDNLFGRKVEDWKRILDEYENIPNKDIQRILQVSYDALEPKEKSVFLDIACCFKGCKWTKVKKILHAHYGHCIEHHVGVLAEKSLIGHWEYDTQMTLHDLIEDMGKEIVRQESPKNPGERSRLWFHDDIFDVLRDNTGTENIEMIYLKYGLTARETEWDGMAFNKMTNLKTLIIDDYKFSGGPGYLPSSLRYLEWIDYDFKSLSCILSKEFNYMKVLKLDYSSDLTHIPDVSGLPNLEKCSFQFCFSLITIHSSIGHLNKLEILNAYGCSKLEHFPPLQLPSLKKFEISKCESLKNFPELLCKMRNIKDIKIYAISIEELPYSFQNFSELQRLKISRCYLRFRKYYDTMNSIVFSNVEHVDLAGNLLSDECLPILLKWFVNVTFLDLSCNYNFTILPECLGECHCLRHLNLRFCGALEEIRGIPPNLESLFADNCDSLSSSSRRMLMSQKLHESGCTHFHFPNTTGRIPDWFEHQSRGETISFWFDKELPSISFTFIIIRPQDEYRYPTVKLFVNGYEKEISCDVFTGKFGELVDNKTVLDNHTTLLHIKLEEDNEPGERLLKNEWIHVEFMFESYFWFDVRNTQMGIHVWKEKSNTEGGVRFIDPSEKGEEEGFSDTEGGGWNIKQCTR